MRHAQKPQTIDEVSVSGGSIQDMMRGDTFTELKKNPNEGAVVRDATAKNEDRPDGPVKWFRVIRGGKFADPNTGVRATLHEGKEIDSRNYNIRGLTKAGIKLEEITDPRADREMDDINLD